MTFDDLFEEEDDAGLANLLADLFPGQEPLLFHLLVCSACRDRATTGLLARYGTSLVLPVGGLEAKSAAAVRRHLRSCLDCALLAGRLAAIQGIDVERAS